MRNVRKNMLRRITDLHCIRRLQSWDETYTHCQNPVMIPAGILIKDNIFPVCVSFIGTFGQMEIYMPYTVSKLYMLFFAVGIISVFFVKETFDLRKKMYVAQRKAVGNDRWKIKTKVISREWNKEGIFHLMMVFLIMIPVFLFLYYVYYSDNQPQGRYLMPALYPLMYFVTLGWNNILTKTEIPES